MTDWIELLLPPEEDEEEEDIRLGETGGVPPPPEERTGEAGTATGGEGAPEDGEDGLTARKGDAARLSPGGTGETAGEAEPAWERAMRAHSAGGPGAPAPRQGDADGPSPGRTRTQAAAGLEALYRQTARAAWAASALETRPVERMVRVQEAERGAALTAEELDRAVRRDSRRYDGGMSIF